jgi:predicted dienelactone hydrolase
MKLVKNRRRLAIAIASGGLVTLGSGFLFNTFASAQKNTSDADAGSGLPKESGVKVSSYKDLTITNPATKRVLDIRIRVPVGLEANQKVPLIIYSPGLGSGLANGAPWCDAWQKAGFIVVTISHPVTNDGIWNTTNASLKANLQAAIAGPQYGLRVSDCQFVITQCLTKLGIEANIDSKKIGIAGHSYGALTTQAITGQNKTPGQHDPRIVAAIAMSPTAATPESSKAMAGVHIPFFCMTGDHDGYITFTDGVDSTRLGVPLAKRKAVYEGLPKGRKQLFVMNNADHMTFAGEPIDAKRFSRDIPVSDELNQESWKRISEITTDFWRSYFSDKPLSEQRAQFKKSVEPIIVKGDIFEIG